MSGDFTGVARSDPTFKSIAVTGNVSLGDAAADLISFHGATKVDQAAAIVSVSTSVAVSVCGLFAFTSAQANGIVTALNAVLAALNEKGLIAS